MKTASTTPTQIKEHISELEYKTNYNATYKKDATGTFKPFSITFPDVTTSVNKCSFSSQTVDELASTQESNEPSSSRDQIRLSCQAINTLESVIEHSFLENKKELRDVINMVFNKNTNRKIYYKAIYDFIDEKINSNEASAATSEIIKTAENTKYKKASQIIISIFLLAYAKKDINERKNLLDGLINACMAYSILIEPYEAGHITKAMSIFNSVNENARKGGNAKARKTLAAVNKAIELINEKRPAGGYQSRSHAAKVIAKDLQDYIKTNALNLVETNYYNRMKSWFSKHSALVSALQLPPSRQKTKPSES